MLTYEDDSIYTKGSIKLDALIWEEGSKKLVISRKIKSKEAWEEVYKDTYKDNYKSIRGLLVLPFDLPLLLKIGSYFLGFGRPLLLAVRVSPNSVLNLLVGA